MRSLVSELLIVVFVLNIWLAVEPAPRAPLYQWFVGLQLITYVAVPAMCVFCRRFDICAGLLSAPFYFVRANVPAFRGLVSYLRSLRAVTRTTVR